MPYTDQQIEALQSAAPDAQAGAVGQLSAAERADLAQSISAYKAKKAQPFTGASDVGTAHATPPQMTEEQSLAASRTGGGGMGEFPAGTEAASQQAAKNRAFLPYAWNTPQHVVNSWVDKLIPPTQKMQAQDTDWWDRRNAAEQQSSAPGVASMFNPLTLAGGKGLGPSTLAGRLAGGGVGGAAYRVTQPNASIGNVATAAGLGVAGAGALEAGQSALSTYLNRGAQTQNGAYISPSVGYDPRTVSPTERALKIIAGTDNILLPPEIMNHESVADIMTQAKQDTHLSQDPTISDIQRRSQGTMGRPDVEKAKDTLQRLTVATAEQHGVNLTLGDISGDPQLRLKEQALESKPGSLMNQFRAQQGAQVRDAIIGLGKNADVDTHSQKFAFEQQPKEQGLTEDQMSLTPDQIMMQELAKERKPSLDLAVQDAQRARAAGEIGSNLTEPEILAKKISGMEANPSNPRAIQLSLEGQHWQNRQIDKLNHDEINDTINDTLADNPSLPKTVNVDPVVDKIKDLIRQNKKSPAYSSEVDSNLNSYLTNLTGGEVKDLSYKNVHYAVSAMEKTIADLKEGGNRNLVQNLQQIKNLLDLQKEKFANQVLADQPDELAKVRRASDFHKDHVVPFQDPDHGITQIINGVDPDKAVKTLFTESSPDQFARIFGHLDPKGQAAVRAELIGRTEDSASRMKNFQDLNLPGVARYLENRADQVHTAYGEDYTLAALANLIRNTPRAGYQSKLESLFGIHSAAGLAGKSIGALGGAAVGGLPGAAIGTGVEMGAEMAANRAVSSHLINPDMQMYLDQNPIPLDSHFAGRTPPTSGTPPTGPGTGMGPGGRWVGESSRLTMQPRSGLDVTVPHRTDVGYEKLNPPMELGNNTHQVPITETPTDEGSSVGAKFRRNQEGPPTKGEVEDLTAQIGDIAERIRRVDLSRRTAMNANRMDAARSYGVTISNLQIEQQKAQARLNEITRLLGPGGPAGNIPEGMVPGGGLRSDLIPMGKPVPKPAIPENAPPVNPEVEQYTATRQRSGYEPAANLGELPPNNPADEANRLVTPQTEAEKRAAGAETSLPFTIGPAKSWLQKTADQIKLWAADRFGGAKGQEFVDANAPKPSTPEALKAADAIVQANPGVIPSGMKIRVSASGESAARPEPKFAPGESARLVARAVRSQKLITAQALDQAGRDIAAGNAPEGTEHGIAAVQRAAEGTPLLPSERAATIDHATQHAQGLQDISDMIQQNKYVNLPNGLQLTMDDLPEIRKNIVRLHQLANNPDIDLAAGQIAARNLRTMHGLHDLLEVKREDWENLLDKLPSTNLAPPLPKDLK